MEKNLIKIIFFYWTETAIWFVNLFSHLEKQRKSIEIQ